MKDILSSIFAVLTCPAIMVASFLDEYFDKLFKLDKERLSKLIEKSIRGLKK